MTARPGQFRALLAALAAMLAVFVQVLTPAAAMAHDLRESGSAMVICTADGSKVVIIAEDGSVRTAPAKGFMGLKCSDCVGPTLAVTLGVSAPAIAPVQYAEFVETPVQRVLGVRGHARAPRVRPARARPKT
ncbi:DUF2946 family protein [Caulobacter sp. RL271]|uniref:DUF2946 family protein n=1 Tax=Caulobacter segnis TaxID=88688 RepID=A0ABY4ZUS9_9CAUL|nr:DUF2946 family protein [Caulobacter segnis]USQ95691.1 DUF2946 family protein [Caulobacter segnis]